MLTQIVAGSFISFLNFGVHALMTGVIIVATHRTKVLTDHMHVFWRLSSLLFITMIVLMSAHIAEIFVWAGFYRIAEVKIINAGVFEFAFENYTALGYGDAVATDGQRLLGPITALNGLLLIGWSVAIIFEVMRMADFQVGRRHTPSR